MELNLWTTDSKIVSLISHDAHLQCEFETWYCVVWSFLGSLRNAFLIAVCDRALVVYVVREVGVHAKWKW